MTAIAILGLQWGDEGKGKIVDILANNAEVVVRCQGGANAGHTVVIGKNVFALHLLPSGILREGIKCVIGNGVVIDPVRLVNEIESIKNRIPDIKDRLYISDRAHMVMPWHKIIDALTEEKLGKASIGTTRQGIGPTYIDKHKRIGIRWHEAKCPDNFEKAFTRSLEAANETISFLGGNKLTPQELKEDVFAAVDKLRPYISDTVAFLHEERLKKKTILLEGAQGAMLDVDFGTYPYVTSSNTTIGGCISGSGMPPNAIKEVHGLLKAFTTRVGAGPFPTELSGELAEKLRGTGKNQWDEFGTTTGRPRRCGWLDLVVAKFAVRNNGVTHLHLTKLDILSQFETLKLCTAYKIDGKITSDFPADIKDLEKCEPVYETMPGWGEVLTSCQDLQSLPVNAQNYVKKIIDFLGVNLASVSYGPGREQTIKA